jgi:beta-glucosidase
MAQATFNFPRGFLWGTATASHQVEGNNTNNNWWAWEQEPGRILHGHKSGLACDWWGGRWREDFDRAAEGGQNAHRLSIEWSRVQPAPGRWDEAALDRYREMLQGLHERGMTPLVTLHHFSEPLWISELGGWVNEEIVGLFETYVRKTVDALKEYTNLWFTINEPNVLAVLSFLLGNFPPGKKEPGATYRALANLARAHSAAYRAIHQIQPAARVGIAIHYRSTHPAKAWFPPDVLLSAIQNQFFNDAFIHTLSNGVLRLPLFRKSIPEAEGTQDFIGLNYYTRELTAFHPLKVQDLMIDHFFRQDCELSETGFIACEPEGMFEALKWANQFGLPIIVAENGVEDSNDVLRPNYLALHLHQMWRAINFNWPVKGYFHWTLVDNFEWERGWTQRFGLWQLNRETQARQKRPSADFYEEICRENALSSDMVSRYAPGVFQELFPG